jgi:uncharacterized membrane protein YkoI
MTVTKKSLGLLLMSGLVALLAACSAETVKGDTQAASPKPMAPESAPATEASTNMEAGNETGMETGNEASEKKLESSQVPAAVQTGFVTKFPSIASANWAKTPYGYESNFMQDGMPYEADFSEKGEWQKTEHKGELPPNIQSKIDQQHSGATIIKQQIEDTPKGMFYQVDLQHEGQVVKLYFDSQGNPAQNVTGG